MEMFCRQCEQTAQGRGCTTRGVCGKSAEAAVLMDLLIYNLEAIAATCKKAGEEYRDPEVTKTFQEGLFSTITNVDFDEDRLESLVRNSYSVLEKVERERGIQESLLPVAERPSDRAGMFLKGATVGLKPSADIPEDISSLREILLHGMKGMAAYADHASILGKHDDTVDSFFYKGLAALWDISSSSETLFGLVLECGTVNLQCMKILDAGHTERFGHPVPVKVSCGAKKGPAIAVSGHDLDDLHQLLEQTAGKGINIYTHGEMLPAHGYPELKKYPHFVGHYGTAWQNQQREFDLFPGAVLMTTNCIQKPRESYAKNIFTTGLVAYPDTVHITAGKDGKKDFSQVIEQAIALGGYPEDLPGKEMFTGCGHNAVLSLAGKVVELVKAGKIRHFFLLGGCDGAKPGRNYYTEFSQKVPSDSIIITLACGKFRFNTLDFGEIEGIPRLLDCGQCNDSYSAILVASALAEAFQCTVNDLPLSLVLSWYEQKAVAILLTLFSLGIRNIRIGPTLPAFVSPGVLKVLAEKFSIQPITTPDEDIAAILG
ncbi:MAG: hydroxylamine reductase [Candidatus Ratteibacteria bacterium]|jgi:hydroxylamine reductase